MRTLSRLSLLLLVTLSAACDLDTLMSAAAVPDGPTGLVAPTRPSTPPRGPQRLASSGAAPRAPAAG
ncbi:MAG: hypothetical protein H6713_37690 [Myxococcales bacterium]|nr:hypothetical protein [Myxococcales bacterium]